MKTFKAANKQYYSEIHFSLHAESAHLFPAHVNRKIKSSTAGNSFRLPKVAKDCLGISQINYLFEVTALLHY